MVASADLMEILLYERRQGLPSVLKYQIFSPLFAKPVVSIGPSKKVAPVRGTLFDPGI
jgi:hypothetical protein